LRSTPPPPFILTAPLSPQTQNPRARRLSTIQDAHRILYIGKGAVLESGTHEELLAARGAYAALVARQVSGRSASQASLLIGMTPSASSASLAGDGGGIGGGGHGGFGGGGGGGG